MVLVYIAAMGKNKDSKQFEREEYTICYLQPYQSNSCHLICKMLSESNSLGNTWMKRMETIYLRE
jgi:hypothetical protein